MMLQLKSGPNMEQSPHQPQLHLTMKPAQQKMWLMLMA